MMPKTWCRRLFSAGLAGAGPPSGGWALAHLRCGHTFAQLAPGFGGGLATAHRCVTEAIEALASLAPTLEEVMAVAVAKATLAAREASLESKADTAPQPCTACTRSTCLTPPHAETGTSGGQLSPTDTECLSTRTQLRLKRPRSGPDLTGCEL